MGLHSDRNGERTHGLADGRGLLAPFVGQISLRGDVLEVERIGVVLRSVGGKVADVEHVAALPQPIDEAAITRRIRGIRASDRERADALRQQHAERNTTDGDCAEHAH